MNNDAPGFSGYTSQLSTDGSGQTRQAPPPPGKEGALTLTAAVAA